MISKKPQPGRSGLCTLSQHHPQNLGMLIHSLTGIKRPASTKSPFTGAADAPWEIPPPPQKVARHPFPTHQERSGESLPPATTHRRLAGPTVHDADESIPLAHTCAHRCRSRADPCNGSAPRPVSLRLRAQAVARAGDSAFPEALFRTAACSLVRVAC